MFHVPAHHDRRNRSNESKIGGKRSTDKPAEPVKFKVMDNLHAILLCERCLSRDLTEQEEAEEIAAWQHLIDNGLVWQLQGWYGRTASSMIANGICTAKEGWNDNPQAAH